MKILVSMTVIFLLCGCETILDTLPDNKKFGELTTQDINAEEIDKILAGLTTETPVEPKTASDIFQFCCEYFEVKVWDDGDINPILYGKIMNTSPNTYEEVVHIVTLYGHEDNVRAKHIIKYSSERDFDRDCRPYSSWWFSIYYSTDITVEDIARVEVTYIDSTLANADE